MPTIKHGVNSEQPLLLSSINVQFKEYEILMMIETINIFVRCVQSKVWTGDED